MSCLYIVKQENMQNADLIVRLVVCDAFCLWNIVTNESRFRTENTPSYNFPLWFLFKTNRKHAKFRNCRIESILSARALCPRNFKETCWRSKGCSLATLSVGAAAVEGPIPAVIRCILSGGGGDRGFGAQPLEHTRPSWWRVCITFRRVSRYLPYVWFWHIITIKHLYSHNGST